MIINSTRIQLASCVSHLALHVFEGEGNDSIKIIQGSRADLDDMLADAKEKKRKYAVRHFTISPQGKTDEQSLKKIIGILKREYKTKGHSIVIVEHVKKRVSGQDNGRHWHVMIAEVSPVDGRVLDSQFFKMKNEKVARLCELALGHTITKGKHNKSVIRELRKENRIDEAVALEASGIDKEKLPKSAYSRGQHEKLKKNGVNASDVKNKIRAAWSEWDQNSPFSYEALGYSIMKGDKKNVWLVYQGELMVGALHRLVGVGVDEANQRMQLMPPLKKQVIKKESVQTSMPAPRARLNLLGSGAASAMLNGFIAMIAQALTEMVMTSLYGLFKKPEQPKPEVKEVMAEPMVEPTRKLDQRQQEKHDFIKDCQSYARVLYNGRRAEIEAAGPRLLALGSDVVNIKSKLDYIANSPKMGQLDQLFGLDSGRFITRLDQAYKMAMRHKKAEQEVVEELTYEPNEETFRPN